MLGAGPAFCSHWHAYPAARHPEPRHWCLGHGCVLQALPAADSRAAQAADVAASPLAKCGGQPVGTERKYKIIYGSFAGTACLQAGQKLKTVAAQPHCREMLLTPITCTLTGPPPYCLTPTQPTPCRPHCHTCASAHAFSESSLCWCDGPLHVYGTAGCYRADERQQRPRAGRNLRLQPDTRSYTIRDFCGRSHRSPSKPCCSSAAPC